MTALMRARKRRGKIKLDPSKKGSLHTALGIPQGQRFSLAPFSADAIRDSGIG